MPILLRLVSYFVRGYLTVVGNPQQFHASQMQDNWNLPMPPSHMDTDDQRLERRSPPREGSGANTQ